MGVVTLPLEAMRVAELGALGAAAADARARGDAEAEETALRAILAIETRNLAALTAMGELLTDRGDRRAARTYLNMALQVAHQFFLMEQGRVTFKGVPGQLAEDEVIQRAYLGTRRPG